MIGLVGALVGIALGVGLNALFGRVGFDFSAFSGTTSYMALITGRIYPSLGLENLPKRALTVAIIAALAALLPAYEAARHEPAQSLHFV